MIFASTYGKGAIFSALPVGVLQGGGYPVRRAPLPRIQPACH